jgi:hypothetical protein
MGAIKQMWLNEERVAAIVLSRSSRRSGPSPSTPDATMDSLSGTQTKEISSSITTAR